MPSLKQIESFNQRRPERDRALACNAPFNNLFLGNRGVVMACCFNKMFVLGNYPGQSLKEIWSGEKAGQLRSAIRQSDFKYGCQNCSLLLEQGNFDALPVNIYDGMAAGTGYPTRMEFELDNTCNLECIMCSGEFSSSIRERRERKPAIVSPYDDEFLRQLEEFLPHLQTAQFLGGEPFLIPVYFKIWERMAQVNPGIKLSIQTNGTILNNRVKKVLGALSASISVSMDGLSKEVYEKVRLNGKIDLVKENIAWLNEYCNEKGTNLSISFCPMPQNWMEIPAMVNYAEGMGRTIFFNSVFYPPECSLMTLPQQELKEITAFLEQNRPLNASAANLRRYNDLVNQISIWATSPHSSVHVAANRLYNNMAELKAALQQYTVEKGVPAAFADMEDKLDFILLHATNDGIYTEALNNLLCMNVANLYDALPGAEAMRLYTLFKERVLKIVV